MILIEWCKLNGYWHFVALGIKYVNKFDHLRYYCGINMRLRIKLIAFDLNLNEYLFTRRISRWNGKTIQSNYGFCPHCPDEQESMNHFLNHCWKYREVQKVQYNF
eukprot:255729_1